MNSAYPLYLVATCVAIGGLFYGTSLYVHRQEAITVDALQVRLADELQLMRELAETIDRDGTDAVTSAVVRDCSIEERRRFDALLTDLSSLRGSDLVEVDRLFALCGSYYNERRAVLLLRFEREFDAFGHYLDLLEPYDARAKLVSYPALSWGELISLERERLRLSEELVAVQGDIIAALRAGTGAQTIPELLTKADSTRAALVSLGTEIDQKRSQLY